ncbi:protease modulator HflC [Aquibacillus salsiterrae]|uniref:Protein HflC n=1 Tax=Aquibacillus salsiterrae TaxID=2950439 RepID=A0A9X3WCY7_9BACI|nr:protease modulator HflC [Aquibacillus salsiterrae]MDC3415740.1 protease modulator HflC [Aquibacillus salsiterrae]
MTDENVVDMKQKSPKEYKKYFRIGSTFLVLVVLLGLFLSSVFIVREGEYKVIRQFGEVIRIEDEPGLKFKVPILHSITTLPQKKMVYDMAEKELNTLDKKRIIIDNYAVWEINNPKLMITNTRTELNAEARMGEFIFSAIRKELAAMNYGEIINEEGSTRGDLNQRILDKVNEMLTRDDYGIEVNDVRIKRTDLPDENQQSVFLRMISERESKAQEYLSQGEGQKKRIIAQTDREVKEMLSKADAKAAQIRAEGEQEAAAMYNEAFRQDVEFYQLYRTLESYKKTINGETTIILPSDSPYARILQGYYE